jgi:hypothetical protein
MGWRIAVAVWAVGGGDAARDWDPWRRELAGALHDLTFESEVLRDKPLGASASRPLLWLVGGIVPGWAECR